MTSARPRVLWLTEEVPDRRLGGGSIRQAHLLEAVANVADTTLVVAGHLRDKALRERVVAVHELPVPPRSVPGPVARRARDLGNALFARQSEETRERVSPRTAIARLVERLGLDAQADVVLVEHAGMAPLLPRSRRARWVCTLHNIESLRLAQQRAVTTGDRQRWRLAREIEKARRLERWIVGAYDEIVVVSPDDAAVLGRGVVVPNGVDTAAVQPTTVPLDPVVVFTGSFAYWPNVDAAVWLAQEVLPRVRSRVPGTRLVLVGRTPVPEVRALAAQPGVEVHADVHSVVPFLQEARVAVAPLRVGTGTRLKVLEAMAAGRPVVGTRIGVEGLGVRPGETALVADDTDGLAVAIARVLGDGALAASLGAAGRAFVEGRYDWSVSGRLLADLVLSLAVAE